MTLIRPRELGRNRLGHIPEPFPGTLLAPGAEAWMEDRRKLELLWLGHLKKAELHLQFARDHLKEVQKDLDAANLIPPDGDFAFRKALRAENFALAEYHRVLVIFTDLVLRGKIPDEAPLSDGGRA